MSHVYSKQGSTLRPIDPEALNVQARLPVGTYTVGMDNKGWFLEQIDNFSMPGKMYGDVDQRANRILRTYMDRPSSTGVLLSGNKGSGKTMLAKRIAEMAAANLNMPTLVINSPICGEEFNSFLQKIAQPIVVLFDEFEKVYDREKQKHLLTIFDGTYVQKKLFVITCNDRYRIDEHMHNRPGRIFYSMDYGSIPREFIEEYCADNLKRAERTAGVVAVSGFFGEFSFDMLKALVEEMNRYDETAAESMRVLNMKPHHDTKVLHDVSFLWQGEKPAFPSWTDTSDTVDASPMVISDWSHYLNAWPAEDKGKVVAANKIDEDGDSNEQPTPPGALRGVHVISLRECKLAKSGVKDGVFVYDTKVPGLQVVFTRRPPRTYTYNYAAA